MNKCVIHTLYPLYRMFNESDIKQPKDKCFEIQLIASTIEKAFKGTLETCFKCMRHSTSWCKTIHKCRRKKGEQPKRE